MFKTIMDLIQPQVSVFSLITLKDLKITLRLQLKITLKAMIIINCHKLKKF